MFNSKEGKKVPNVTFKTRKNGEWLNVTTNELFKNKKIILFSLPGAFTPTCSSAHLPRYDELYETFKESGVDEIIVMSVNDTFVMNAWKEDQQSKNIKFIPDGNGEFTEQMGLLVDKSDLGFGKRSWRYSMLVDNGIIVKQFIEPQEQGDPFKVSDADTMLNYITDGKILMTPVTIFTKPDCKFCKKAKTLLEKMNYKYDELTVDKEIKGSSLFAVTGKNTVPQIFIGGKHIASSEELEIYFNNL
jgi:glutaredoxin-like protein